MQDITMQLEQRHIDALEKAEAMMVDSGFRQYLELKSLFADGSPSARVRFRPLFTNYYRLNVGGLTDEFKDRYFEILFGDDVIVNGQPNFSSILKELFEIRTRKNLKTMQFSFVSKLVAIHLESSPIYDKFVLAFFRETAPGKSLEPEKRIEWYVALLNRISASYNSWASEPRVAETLARLKDRDAQLAECDVVRLMDFLVWKVGSEKLLTN